MTTNSPCIEHLGGNRYRCRNRGYVIETDVLPIHCGCGSVLRETSGSTRRCGQQRIRAANNALILVIGLHRSLSSCLAVMLEKLGVYMGDTNSGGEDRTLQLLCEDIMPFPATEKRLTSCWRSGLLGQWLEELAADADGRPFGGKYPHLAALAPELRKAWSGPVKVIHADRPLDESIASLVTRSANAKDPRWRATRGQCGRLQFWLAKKKQAWLQQGHLDVRSVDLFRNPAGEVRRIVRYLGLQPSQKQRWEAVSYVRPSRAIHTAHGADDRWCADTTVCIKTFERPEMLDVCIRSVRDRYPEARILVADDSARPASRTDVEVLRLPYDVGLSAGRNAMALRVRTPHLLMLDDDMIFTTATNVQRLRDAVESCDLAAGVVLGKYGWPRVFEGHFVRAGGELRAEPGPDGKLPSGLPAYHVVENFYLARTDMMQKHPYDAEHKVGEHMDWLLSLWLAGAQVTCVPDVQLIDMAYQPSRLYGSMRGRAARFSNPTMRRRCAELGFCRFVRDLDPSQPPRIIEC